jgi:hypothetical protein
MLCKTTNYQIICLILITVGFIKTMGFKYLKLLHKYSQTIMDDVLSTIPYTSPTICKKIPLPK